MIDLSPDQKELITTELRRFLNEELDQDLGTFEAMDLLDFLTEKIAPLYYNRGLLDAQTVLSKQSDALIEAVALLEKPSQLER